VSQWAKENLLHIGTNLKCDRLKVPNDPGCEPDGGFGCVPAGKGDLAPYWHCSAQIVRIFLSTPVQLAAKQRKVEKEKETLIGQ
jgi:hypothetical protein